MKRKSIIGITCMTFTALAFLMLIVTGTSGPALGAEFVLKATSAFPKTAKVCVSIPTMIKMFEKESGGRIKIKWLGGPEVIKTFDQAEALKRGTVDMLLYHPFGYFKSLMPVALSKGLSECTAWEERANGAYDLWVEVFKEKVNAMYLGQIQSLVRFHVFSRKKITKVEDFKGLVIRVMPLYVPYLKALGASPVTMPPPDVYTALKRGVVDACMWPILISDWGWHEVAKYAIFPGIFQIEPSTLVNLDTWNKLPKDLQDSMINAFKKLEPIGTKEFEVEVEKEWATQKAAGGEQITLPPAEAKKFREVAYEETWKEVIKMAPVYGPQFRKLTYPCKK